MGFFLIGMLAFLISVLAVATGIVVVFAIASYRLERNYSRHR